MEALIGLVGGLIALYLAWCLLGLFLNVAGMAFYAVARSVEWCWLAARGRREEW